MRPPEALQLAGQPVATVLLRRRQPGRRNGWGEWEAGVWLDGHGRALEAAVLPVAAGTLQEIRAMERGGSRLQDARRFRFAAAPDVAAIREAETGGDLIILDGAHYRILQVRRWRTAVAPAGSGGTVEVLAVRELPHRTAAEPTDFTPSQREVDRVIRAAVAEGTGLAPEAVIPGDDDGPRPLGEYGAVTLARSTALPPPERRHRNAADYSETGELDSTADQAVQGTWEVTLYGAGAVTRLFRMSAKLRGGAGSRALQAARMSLQEVTGPRNDTVLQSGAEWEPRSSVDMTVTFSQRLTERTASAVTLDVSVALDDAHHDAEQGGLAVERTIVEEEDQDAG